MYRRYYCRFDDWWREWKVIDKNFDDIHSSHDTYEEASKWCEILNAVGA